MKIRPTKEHAIEAAILLAPQYAGLLKDLQKDNNSPFFSYEISNIQMNLGNYVLMYDDERKIGRALLIAILGDEGYKDLNIELNQLNVDEQQEQLNDFLDDFDQIVNSANNFQIPSTKTEWEEARKAFAKLSDEEKLEAQKHGTAFWCGMFSSFFNTLSLMVHGTKLTTLVPRAILGDDAAYLKAIQIDRMLLIKHPYFRERKFKAQDDGQQDFLERILYREANSPLRGKIRYPALYMLFGILETFGWLEDLKREEILDICDVAKLERYQNRIEDLSYLNKRLLDYRKWQNLNNLSMP